MPILSSAKLLCTITAIFLIVTTGCTSFFYKLSGQTSPWQNALFCSEGLTYTGKSGSSIRKINGQCTVVEKKDKLYFYLNSGVKTLKAATVFSDDEKNYCEEFANASTTGKNFEKHHDHYIKLLLNQFPIKNIKPFSHENSLLFYSKKFANQISACINTAKYIKRKDYERGFKKIHKHIDLISKQRKIQQQKIKAVVALRSLKRVSKGEWLIKARVGIVNNGRTDYKYARRCDSNSLYATNLKNVKVIRSKCPPSSRTISQISSKGVFRDEIYLSVKSQKRPTHLKIKIFFSSAPHFFLGSVTIPEKSSY